MDGFTVDHVAIAVPSINDAAPTFELLMDHRCSRVEELPDQGVNVAFVGSLELIEPRGPDTSVARFIKSHGAGLHHIAFRVPDISEALAKYRESGVRLIDEEPRPGARGHRVAFLHPRSMGGVLVELVQE
jgi:methylmalonyl-CoA/ethylmalonyl-CoA epimerase